MGSSGARVRKVQVYQTRQFTLNILEFISKIEFNFYHHEQFRGTSEESSGAPNPAVHLEHARIFI
jgi:hypothetical protein